MWSVVSFVQSKYCWFLRRTRPTIFCPTMITAHCTFKIELRVPIHSVYSITPTSDADMLLKRFLTKREALLTASIGVFVLIELWTSPRPFFDANNCNNDSSVIMKHQEYDPLWQFIRADSKEIRKWGCNRTETPTIFVHIGKSGGGSVGARIAAASFNYTKMKHRESDGSYYPLDNNSKARFIASSFTTHLPSAERTYEGTSTCHASTPLGQAIGCPELLQRIRMDQDNHRHGECNEDSDTCHLVYQGHNFFGSELHWLPAKYLRNWWNTRWRHMPDFSLFWSKLVPNHTWCLSKNISRPVYNLDYKKVYEECSIPLQRQVDTEASHALVQQLSIDDSKVITSWSPLYASLPVLRVTVMRDPFSWLVSKYFWHRRQPDLDNNSTCDNINEALLDNSGIPRPHELDMDNSGLGWLSKMSLGYIMYLCGEDCIVRYAAGTATLQDLELQAEGNLRQSFAVVGLLEEVDTFYEMLTARIQYVNTSLNPQVRGDIHHSGGKLENVNCKTRFNNPNFRARLLARSPELRVINRLYQVAKEVNRFQLQELRQCSPSTFAAEEPTMD